jgi:hypothetical protein
LRLARRPIPGIVELEASPVFAYHDRAVAVDV